MLILKGENLLKAKNYHGSMYSLSQKVEGPGPILSTNPIQEYARN